MTEDELKDLEAELQREQDALRAAVEAGERARRASQLRDDIETAKRLQREAAACAEAEAKHGPLAKGRWGKVDTLDGLVLVHQADPVKLKKWQDENIAADGPISADAYRELGRPCVFYPEIGDFDAAVKERPLTMTHVTLEVLRLGGLKSAARGKA